nr:MULTISPECIES: hypothetical protein [Paraliobacillus]
MSSSSIQTSNFSDDYSLAIADDTPHITPIPVLKIQINSR